MLSKAFWIEWNQSSAERGFAETLTLPGDKGRARCGRLTSAPGRVSLLFEPQGSGTLVTESYEVIEPITAMGWFVIGTLYGNHDRRAGLRQGMTQTLERLREVAERSTTGG